MSALSADYKAALAVSEPVLQVQQILEAKQRTQVFRDELDDEDVLSAKARASAGKRSGKSKFSFEKRDVESVRRRADSLLRRIDRYLDTVAPARLEGSGYYLADGRLQLGFLPADAAAGRR